MADVLRAESVDSGLVDDLPVERGDSIESFLASDVAYDLISRATGINFSGYTRRTSAEHDAVLETMRRKSDEMINKHPILFQGMIKRLESRNEFPKFSEEYTPLFVAVGKALFKDNVINWGRIIALYAFAIQWARHLDRKAATKEEIESVAEVLAQFVDVQLTKWIREKGGWEDIVTHFPARFDWELPIFRGLLVTGLGLGVLAGLLAMR